MARTRNRNSLTIETFFPKPALIEHKQRNTPPIPATHMLPPELWRRVLEEAEETNQLAPMWQRYRQVCRTFRDIVDKIFEQRVLDDMILEFDLGSAYMNERERTEKVYFGFEMRFDRFAEDDREVVIFKNDVDRTQRDPIWWARHDMIERRLLDDKMFFYPLGDAVGAEAIDTRFDQPPWTIEIRGRINDTALPDWRYDHSTRELSFRWKDAMTAFYRETDYIDQCVMLAIRRAVVSGEYEALYQAVHTGRISMAKHWIETTKIREYAAARARRQIRNHRMERWWRYHHSLDPDKHTYSIDFLLEFRDRMAEFAALQKMREMEWSRSDGLLAAIPAYDGGDPLEDPMIENFIQRVFFSDGHPDDEMIGDDDDEAGQFADDDMEFTDGYMTDASTLATETDRSTTRGHDFLPLEEDLWTIEEEDAASLEEFEAQTANVTASPAHETRVETLPSYRLNKIEVADKEPAAMMNTTTRASNVPMLMSISSIMNDDNDEDVR